MNNLATQDDVGRQTIEDFGRQWQAFRANDGYYGSVDLFLDAFPLLDPSTVAGARVVDIGSGSGRIVRMLLAMDASHVTAVEPSAAYQVLRQNVAEFDDRVVCLNIKGDALPPTESFDLAISYGVLHHIPQPLPVVRAVYHSLKPGGKFCAWLYGREGNEAYCRLVLPIRTVTSRLPHLAVVALSWCLDPLLSLYTQACRILPLPLRGYLVHVVSKLAADKRRLVIYDQLKPRYAKYYTRDEAIELFRLGGFEDIRVHHRHGYSWTVLGVKPD
jgi:SAM-dependent methyltransferase